MPHSLLYSIEYWKAVQQPTIYTLQVMTLEYRDGKQTADTCMSWAEKIPYIYFVTVYRAKNPFKLGERAYFYFFTLNQSCSWSSARCWRPVDFASRLLQPRSSPGCVQPCTVYHNPFYEQPQDFGLNEDSNCCLSFKWINYYIGYMTKPFILLTDTFIICYVITVY